jgi:type IV secretory pathway TraG/TraD family ATPase VirD4
MDKILTDLHPLYVLYTVAVVIGLAIARSALIILLRAVGLYHPGLYRFWPRLPWRSLMRLWMSLTQWWDRIFCHGKMASGGFASVWAVLTNLYTPQKIFIGRAYGLGVGWLQPVGIPVSRHLFVYAMSGAGKSTYVITMLSCWQGSAFVIDPKGQLTFVLKEKDHRTWVVLAPYEEITDQWNPFDDLKAAIEREGQSAAVKWATRIAAALIVTPSNSKTPYFTYMARAFVTSLILQILTYHDETSHTLGYMRELIIHGYRIYNEDATLESTAEESRELLYKLMSENNAFAGAVAGGFSGMRSASGETAGNVLSTLQEQTKWLDLPSVKAMLERTTRPLSDLKTRNDMVLSFVAPVLSIREELAPLTGLLTNMATYTFEAVKEKKGQTLFLIDELQAQGRNTALEVALPVGRSYGQTIVGIAQDVEGMKSAYPTTYKAFTGNADAVL